MYADLPRLVVFDLDGTLIDSSLDLCLSVNAALQHVNRPALPHSLIASYIGDGANVLMQRALGRTSGLVGAAPVEPQVQETALCYFLEFYRAHKLDHTRLYDGVLDSLLALRAMAPTLPMAVLTNKPVRPSVEICEALGLSPFFFAVYGGNSFATKKPHPEGLLTLMAETVGLGAGSSQQTVDLRAEEVLMVGDSSTDVQTARNAGARSLGCRYGLAPESLEKVPPDLICDHPRQWPALMQNFAARTMHIASH